MITGPQLRAARGLLDWTRTELAEFAKISPETVKNIEHGTFRPQEDTAQKIYKTFAQYDVVFTEDQGVKIAKETVKTFVGVKGYHEFLNDIYNTMRSGGVTRQFNFSDTIIATYGGEHLEQYNKNMQSIENLDARCLVPEGDQTFPVKHCNYKWLKKIHKNEIPYFLYGNKVAVLTSPSDKEMIWVIIYSESLVKAYMQQFDTYWDEAEAIPAKNKK